MKFPFEYLVESASKCEVCEESGYQAPPALCIGNLESPILIIAQNPGEILDSDTVRRMRAKKAWTMEPKDLINWYRWDFGTSSMYGRLEKVFGRDWLTRYLYTNAVLCRTKGNETPSKEMVKACSVWTNQLAHRRKGIVTIGAVARNQITKGLSVPRYKSVILRKAGLRFLSFNFYIKPENLKRARSEFKRLEKGIGGER